jgi:hypothetical protein
MANGTDKINAPVESAVHPEKAVVRVFIGVQVGTALRTLLFNPGNCLGVEQAVKYSHTIST